MVVVVVRPSLWEGELAFELGLAKTGMFLGVYMLMFWTMFGEITRKTAVHRAATLSKGALLLGGIAVSSFFWAGYTFPYLDSGYLLSTSLANLFIVFPIGGLIIALIW